MTVATRLPCPTCKREISWSEQFPWRPFCSERCKLVDLGAWLSESHAIPGEPVDDAPGAGHEGAGEPERS